MYPKMHIRINMLRFIFHTEKDLIELGRNREAKARIITGMNEKQKVEIMLEKITNLYGYYSIIATFISLLKRHRKEVFLDVQDPMVKKTS